MIRNFVKSPIAMNTRTFSTSRGWRNKKLSLTVVGLGIGAAAVVSSKLWNRVFGQHMTKYTENFVPFHEPIRQIRSETDSTGLKLTLYQYQTCPFCCKTRAFLDYHGFSYNVVEVNSVRRKELEWTKYPKVPVLVCHGIGNNGYLQINDSSMIISLLDSFLLDRSKAVETLLSYYPQIETKGKRGKTVYDYPNKYFLMLEEGSDGRTDKQRSEERKWRRWVDEWLVHTLSPNVYRTPSEALQAFRYFDKVGQWEKVFSSTERQMVIYVGATAMYFLGKILKSRHKLKPDVRESLYDACEKWMRAVGNKRTFMGGDQPNLADLSVYGVLSSIEGCNAFQDLQNQNAKLKKWYYKMQTVVDTHQGAHPAHAKRTLTS